MAAWTWCHFTEVLECDEFYRLTLKQVAFSLLLTPTVPFIHFLPSLSPSCSSCR